MEEANLDRSIGRLEGKVDFIIKEMSDLKGAFSVLEAGRLSKLESQVSGLIVKVGVISGGIALIVTSLAQLVVRYFLKV